jgi:hypothetical protein
VVYGAHRPEGLASPNTAKGERVMSKKNSSSSKSKVTKAAAKPNPDLVPLSQMNKAKKAEAKVKKVSCLDAAVQVLKSEGKPMTCKAMIDAMFAKKLWHSDAPTPAATLYSAILRELQPKKTEARFKKTDRGLFTINGK